MATPSEELDQEIHKLLREVIESRALIIKTNNLTGALSADVKSIGRRLAAQERRLVWTSTTAYIAVVLVGLIGGKLAIDARTDAVRAETEKDKAIIERLSREVRELQKREEERIRAENRASALVELLRAQRRAEFIEQWESVKKEPLTKAEVQFFSDAVDRAKSELSTQAYLAGIEHARFGRWFEAQQAFEESLKYKDTAPHAASAKYRAAEALRKLGKQKEAVVLLAQVVEASSDKEIVDDALFLIAECYVDLQNWNDAKAALRQLIKRFPDSPLLGDARMMLAEISVKH